jgi:hypothetical protein
VSCLAETTGLTDSPRGSSRRAIGSSRRTSTSSFRRRRIIARAGNEFSLLLVVPQTQPTPPRMPSLPLELYTPILDGVDRADLFRLSLVSRTFQTEAEQRIHRSIYFHSWRHILASLKRLLSVPRIFSFIKELSITDDNNRPYEEGPHSYIFLSAVFRTLGSALARMTELVFLSVSAYAAGESRYWVTCRGLFERSTFQVHALRCPFAMDISLISFLAKQPHIHEFFWYPISSANHKLCPPTLLPMLSTVHFKHTEMDQILPLVTSRPLTHCWWMYEASTFEFLRLSSVLIRAIRYQPFQSDELSILAQRCPDLEHLEFIEFGEVRVSTK